MIFAVSMCKEVNGKQVLSYTQKNSEINANLN